jgi:hypothetical protein
MTEEKRTLRAGKVQAAARKAFGEATRKAAKKALDAGLRVPGRIAGRRVEILPDGKVIEPKADD